ncbi:hypothetical protein [Streptomyces carpinensis]|uniref:HPP family protein n=1 Tax=Streptomyces carpinensis TaxID=66369 RepID=A0ABV1VX44_9ACTN|nr:hypothetical protein [Streptomyces carpinensis]
MTDNVNDATDHASSPAGPDPLLTPHTALVLLAAAFIGLVTGGLTFLAGGPAAGAVLAGLTGFGGAVPVLHQMIG